MNSTLIYVGIMIIILILCVLIYYYYWLPRQSNASTYEIPLITNETIFSEDYSNTLNLETELNLGKFLISLCSAENS